MRRLLLLVGVILLAVGIFSGTAFAARPVSPPFFTTLSGDEEVPPVETDARGAASFQLSQDGSSLTYTLLATNIEDVTMAHIHLAPVGENGPVVVWLYGMNAQPRRVFQSGDSLFVHGSISEDDLVGPLADASFEDLLAAMRAGDTYVNVHTELNPAGEIRGQLSTIGVGMNGVAR